MSTNATTTSRDPIVTSQASSTEIPPADRARIRTPTATESPQIGIPSNRSRHVRLGGLDDAAGHEAASDHRLPQPRTSPCPAPAGETLHQVEWRCRRPHRRAVDGRRLIRVQQRRPFHDEAAYDRISVDGDLILAWSRAPVLLGQAGRACTSVCDPRLMAATVAAAMSLRKQLHDRP